MQIKAKQKYKMPSYVSDKISVEFHSILVISANKKFRYVACNSDKIRVEKVIADTKEVFPDFFADRQNKKIKNKKSVNNAG